MATTTSKAMGNRRYTPIVWRQVTALYDELRNDRLTAVDLVVVAAVLGLIGLLLAVGR